jgi:transcriptional regulator with XRE-family HTH domain
MRAREIVGYRMRQERGRLGISQAAVAEVLTGLTGKTWFPQAIAEAEQGRRAFTVDDLIAITMALGTNIPHLLMAPPGETVDIGPHRFTDWDEQPDVSLEDRLVADLERATQALADYMKGRK